MLISSELPEIIGLSDRIYVMQNGRITGELPGRRGRHRGAGARARDGRPPCRVRRAGRGNPGSRGTAVTAADTTPAAPAPRADQRRPADHQRRRGRQPVADRRARAAGPPHRDDQPDARRLGRPVLLVLAEPHEQPRPEHRHRRPAGHRRDGRHRGRRARHLDRVDRERRVGGRGDRRDPGRDRHLRGRLAADRHRGRHGGGRAVRRHQRAHRHGPQRQSRSSRRWARWRRSTASRSSSRPRASRSASSRSRTSPGWAPGGSSRTRRSRRWVAAVAGGAGHLRRPDRRRRHRCTSSCATRDYGRSIYSIGGNATAARLAGMNLRTIRIVMYVISGAIAGLAGVAADRAHDVGQPDQRAQPRAAGDHRGLPRWRRDRRRARARSSARSSR